MTTRLGPCVPVSAKDAATRHDSTAHKCLQHLWLSGHSMDPATCTWTYRVQYRTCVDPTTRRIVETPEYLLLVAKRNGKSSSCQIGWIPTLGTLGKIPQEVTL